LLSIEVDPDLSAEDVKQLRGLVAQLSSSAPLPTEDHILAILSSPHVHLVVAYYAGELAGVLVLVAVPILTGIRALVEDVVVDEGFRGKGIGKALVLKAIELARAEGARYLDLTSRPERVAANALYEGIGFKRRETNAWRLELGKPGPADVGIGAAGG
jgi:ribosomal protein S18 acetylase RimI-like enzyme